jgi:hypothetical protein
LDPQQKKEGQMASLLIGFSFLIGLAIAALILSAACRMVGVEPPDLFPAMVIVFIVMIAQGMLGLLLGAVMAFGAGITGTPTKEQLLELTKRTAPIALILSPIVSAPIYSLLLRECSFGKGLLLWVAQLIVLAAFTAGVVVLFYTVLNIKV